MLIDKNFPVNSIVDSLEKAEKTLVSKSDISNRILDGLSLSDIVSAQSLFSGSIFRNCHIESSDFSRSDFEGAKFESCKLKSMDFSSSDIRSTSFYNCTFIDCCFADSYISDVAFINCNVTSTSFIGSGVQNSKFIKTSLNEITQACSTFLHNTFSEVDFNVVNFSDCTSLYSFFEKCTFNEFSINIDSLGMIYGISELDLQGIDLIFLGGDAKKPTDFDVRVHVVEQFAIRQWPLHAMIAALNFSVFNSLDSWNGIIDILCQRIKNNIGANKDEAKFVIELMQVSENDKKLPLGAVLRLKEKLNLIESKNENIDLVSLSVLNVLSIGVQPILIKMSGNLVTIKKSIPDLEENEILNFRFIFLQKPSVNIENYFECLIEAAGYESAGMVFYPSISGSWIKPIQATTGYLTALLISLYLVEGCLIKVTSIRARAEVLINNDLPSHYIEEALSPNQNIPQEVRDSIKLIMESYINKTLTSPELPTGVNQRNIQEIQIR